MQETERDKETDLNLANHCVAFTGRERINIEINPDNILLFLAKELVDFNLARNKS